MSADPVPWEKRPEHKAAQKAFQKARRRIIKELSTPNRTGQVFFWHDVVVTVDGK